ncbi:hypothetical protein SAMN05892877_112172 [Rhizobium subbaraonis]|uniref:DUF1513 domain-containing protein n=1 Tax=Rhizobium subbaraonis TaxID=908946 RepID=A0A285UR72_9HYPH|nr:DUF1513 domain-containing protein [Rhizobium subbaraonis]SOC44360.1 hypothetical protein SAMN05892877_112172 [Rhizobium subbaraonis]
MRTPLLDRRSFMKMAGAAWTATLAPSALYALERSDAVFASGFMARDGGFGVATLSEDGTIIDTVSLPARSHGMAYSAESGHTAAFARRPGTFALIFDTRRQAEPVTIHAGEGRHFFGHGSFSPDGRLLYASENDFDGSRGVIGLYDATDRYRRVGEFDTHGIGTHDMTVSDDGRMLVVANGGIETHPDFGRTKLNLDHMEPSLALIDAATGMLIERHAMPPALRQLSTRHVDIDGRGRVWFACQYEGPRNDLPPLAGHFAKGEDITFLELPAETTHGLANYVGAIAVNRSQGLVGLTSPKGGTAVTIDAATGRVIREDRIADAAGIAASRRGFTVSSYDGRFDDQRAGLSWDQHIVRFGKL